MDSITKRWTVIPLACAALVMGACSDDGFVGQSSGAVGDTTSGTSNGSNGETSANSTTAPPGTTGTPEQTEATGDTQEPGDGSTGEDANSSGSTTEEPETSDSSGDGESSTGEMDNIEYSAIALPGGLDRIRIFKADLDNDRCTWVTLVSPEIPGMYPGMTVPAMWSVENVSINDVAASCGSDNPAMFGAEAALDANGTITFGMLGGTGIYPCMLDIDATFDFAGMLPGIPPMDDMVAIDVMVTGC